MAKDKDPRSVAAERDHNRGQKDGANSGVAETVLWLLNPFTSSDYDKGFENGTKNRK